ncbi:MAG: hypothetical protein APF81_12615 [Desulfosporosinus sp. BRH_c37]|nr:MAG: hypothetical protein APF81_12615 [Desulfosporosinus sp. BRH_c37]
MKTQFEGAIIEEQGKKIAVVSVQARVFQNAMDANIIIKALLPLYKGMPVVLVTKNNEGVPAYYGRADLVLFLETINIEEASWSQVSADIDLNNGACPSNQKMDIDD